MHFVFMRSLRPLRSLRSLRPLPLAVFAAAAALLFCAPAAQARETDSQLWTQLTVNARYPSGLRLFAEMQPRFGDNYSRASQFIFRPAVGYQVSPTVSVWLGYGLTPNLLPDYTHEDRLFQQVLVENRYTGFEMQNRTRLEQRFIDGAGGTSLRLRHQVRLSRPLEPTKRWAAVASNELFWNLNSTPSGPQSGFDQTRPYLGVAYSMNKQTRVELGYLAAFVNSPRSRPDRRLDALLLSMNYNL